MKNWKRIRVVASGIAALVSCPCHVPLILPILLSVAAGTGIGVWLANNTHTVFALSTLIFMSSLIFTLRWSSAASQEAGHCDLTNSGIKQREKAEQGIQSLV